MFDGDDRDDAQLAKAMPKTVDDVMSVDNIRYIPRKSPAALSPSNSSNSSASEFLKDEVASLKSKVSRLYHILAASAPAPRSASAKPQQAEPSPLKQPVVSAPPTNELDRISPLEANNQQNSDEIRLMKAKITEIKTLLNTDEIARMKRRLLRIKSLLDQRPAQKAAKSHEFDVLPLIEELRKGVSKALGLHAQ